MLENLREEIEQFAFPFFERMRNEKEFFTEINRMGLGVTQFNRDRYLPILHKLKGQDKSGLKIIEESIERQGKPDDISIVNKRRCEDESFVIHAGIDNTSGNRNFDDVLKKLPDGGSIVIVGTGHDKVDPEYLKFAKNYMNIAKLI